MQWNPILLILRWQVNTVRLLAAIIPANPGSRSGAGVGIQSVSGCRIKSGMTNYWNAESTRRYFLITIGLVTGLSLFGSWSCSRGGYSGKLESITIGILHVEAAGLIYLTGDRKLFAANGLNATVKNYDTGVATIDALLKGEVNIAWAAEYPFVTKVLEREKISIIAVIDRFSYFYLLGRKDRGIKKTQDLKWKKIGVSKGTISEFYLGRFMALNGMAIKDLNVVNIAPSKFVGAFTSGSIDGIIAWRPFVNQIRNTSADKVVEWSVQSGQAAYGVVIARNDWIGAHMELVNRFLKSIAQAEEYLIRQPAQAKAIIQKWMNYDDASMVSAWAENQYSLCLDQSLVAAMEDEARWMIKNNLTTETKVPDFMNYIYVDGLKAVKPEAVTIIR